MSYTKRNALYFIRSLIHLLSQQTLYWIPTVCLLISTDQTGGLDRMAVICYCSRNLCSLQSALQGLSLCVPREAGHRCRGWDPACQGQWVRERVKAKPDPGFLEWERDWCQAFNRLFHVVYFILCIIMLCDLELDTQLLCASLSSSVKMRSLKIKGPNVPMLVLTNVRWLRKMLTVGETEWGVYGNSLLSQQLSCKSKIIPNLEAYEKT